MREVYPNIFVGDDTSAMSRLAADTNGWHILHAAKERWHRSFVGYSGRGAPKDSPEYLYARRGNRMALNMVDAKSPEFFSKKMIEAGLLFLDEGYKKGKKLLIHCNRGESRGPAVAMLYICKYLIGPALDGAESISFEQAEATMKESYPLYAPGEGIRGHLRDYWEEY